MGTFDQMVSVPNLQPLNEEQQAAVEAFAKEMREVTIPEIVQAVEARERRAAEYRAAPYKY